MRTRDAAISLRTGGTYSSRIAFFALITGGPDSACRTCGSRIALNPLGTNRTYCAGGTGGAGITFITLGSLWSHGPLRSGRAQLSLRACFALDALGTRRPRIAFITRRSLSASITFSTSIALRTGGTCGSRYAGKSLRTGVSRIPFGARRTR